MKQRQLNQEESKRLKQAVEYTHGVVMVNDLAHLDMLIKEVESNQKELAKKQNLVGHNVKDNFKHVHRVHNRKI